MKYLEQSQCLDVANTRRYTARNMQLFSWKWNFLWILDLDDFKSTDGHRINDPLLEVERVAALTSSQLNSSGRKERVPWRKTEGEGPLKREGGNGCWAPENMQCSFQNLRKFRTAKGRPRNKGIATSASNSPSLLQPYGDGAHEFREKRTRSKRRTLKRPL